MADWQKLADDFIGEFDAASLKCRDRDENGHTHLANSQYVVSLHHDSKGRILHLHINARSTSGRFVRRRTASTWRATRTTNIIPAVANVSYRRQAAFILGQIALIFQNPLFFTSFFRNFAPQTRESNDNQ